MFYMTKKVELLLYMVINNDKWFHDTSLTLVIFQVPPDPSPLANNQFSLVLCPYKAVLEQSGGEHFSQISYSVNDDFDLHNF